MYTTRAHICVERAAQETLSGEGKRLQGYLVYKDPKLNKSFTLTGTTSLLVCWINWEE